MWRTDEALRHWGEVDGPVEPEPDGGLINRTWRVGGADGTVRRILQWVSPIFDPRIHLDVDALTRHLERAGLTTPRLLPTAGGRLWIEDPESGFWRLQTWVPGRTVHRLAGLVPAASAGDLVGRFHAVLADWSYVFQARSRFIHDTPSRMAELRLALDEVSEHPLAGEAAAVGEELLRDWRRWLDERGEDELDHRLPQRPCHGDLKASNLRFSADRAVALLDLDTVGRMSLASEMGDAWRSWCNPAGEDDPDRCVFDQAIFAASAGAWIARAPILERTERRALVPAIERICLELGARFCADALRNSYFREDRRRYPEPGRHNLVRARCQLRLAASARACRDTCEAVIAR